jgi:hypothetical protein
MEKYDFINFIYSINKYTMKSDKVIIIRLPDNLKKEYESLLNENGMNLSKRIKLLIGEDIKKLKKEI